LEAVISLPPAPLDMVLSFGLKVTKHLRSGAERRQRHLGFQGIEVTKSLSLYAQPISRSKGLAVL
jgi:hypothetical protein